MALSEADTTDAFLGARLQIRQAAKGFRAGLDSILLATAVAAPAEGRALEVGCGAGAALLAAATLNPGFHVTGVERHPLEAERARRNAATNGLDARVAIVEGDPLTNPGLDLGAPFDAAWCNPPFNAQGREPTPDRSHAHHGEHSLKEWVNAFANRLKGRAALVMIHRADALGEVLQALQGRLGGVVVRPVHPFADKPAHRILVKAVKGSRAPLTLLPPLVLHEAGAKHTPETEALLRGEARLSWD